MKTIREIRHFHLACGLGGGAKGFNRGQARVGTMEAKFRCIGGIDVDPAAIRDFQKLAGVPGTVMDLFSRQQYAAFHGHPPPDGWNEATPQDMQRAAGGERPHIVFASFPCKGFSGLLSEARSKTGKYQALNELALRGVWLMLEAWKDDPVELFVFENVPRIANRGRHLLDQMTQLLHQHGYAIAETTHDCGELGGLAQSRKRFLMVARHMEKVPAYLYQPDKRPLRAVGDVLGKMPMPGHPAAGPIHRMPALQWKTWVRLAFVEAGKDWRSLQGLRVQDGMLTDFGIVPAVGQEGSGAYGVREWGEPSGVIATRCGPTNGAFSIADPRIDGHPKSVQMGVKGWDQTAGVVTGKMFAGGGPNSVADPRAPNVLYNHAFRIVRWGDTAPAVHGGGAGVADPRVEGPTASHGNVKVTEWDSHAGAITTQRSPGAGAACLADPRLNWHGAHENKMRVSEWDKPARTVTGSDRVGSGALSVADPRPGFGPATHHNVLHVTDWESHAKTISGANHPSGGSGCVADPRHPGDGGMGKYRVTAYDEPSGVVISGSTTGQGAFAVADPNPALHRVKGDHYATGGHYGVIRWGDTAFTISGHASLDNGWNSVGDPRPASDLDFAQRDSETEEFRLPEATHRLICVIRALDGTWHRPFTTLELAALQSLVDPEEHLELSGLSDSAWRERIGNAVPPEAACAIASVFGKTLLMAWAGHSFTLSSEPIWVQPIALALAVHIPQGV